ncbi:polya polymerase, partial [Thermodesulfobacteriota bacterium]
IQLNPGKFGTLIDFFSAQKDIKAKAIRVLHNLSFVEDPTRAFRAIRFEQRFGFAIGKLTSGLIENAVKMGFFKRLSGRRVFTELRQILEEENPMLTIVRLNEYNLLTVIYPAINLNNEMVSLFSAVKKALAWYDLLFLEESYMKWSVYFLALIKDCDRNATDEICNRFELAPRLRIFFAKERFKAIRCLSELEQMKTATNSQLYEKLSVFKTELILYMMAAAKTKRVKKLISNYFTRLRPVEISVTGSDLKKMGLKPGPLYREVMDAILHAKLNGQLKTRGDEIEFLNTYVS